MLSFVFREAWRPLMSGVIGVLVGTASAFSAVGPSVPVVAPNSYRIAQEATAPSTGTVQPPTGTVQPSTGTVQPPTGMVNPMPSTTGVAPMPPSTGGSTGGMMQPPSSSGTGGQFPGKTGSWGGKQGMGAPGMGSQEGSQGPSEDQIKKMEEQQQKMEEEQEAKRAEMEKKQLAQMKKGLSRAASELKRMQALFDKFTTKGIAVPSDCADALTKAQSVIEAVMNAETMDAAQEAGIEDIRDNFETLQECRQKLEMLSRIPMMLKKVDREISRVEREWERAKKGATEAVSNIVSEGDATIAAIKDARVKIDEVVKSGDVEEMQQLLEDSVFGKFDDVRAAIQRLQAAKNSKRFVAEFQRQIRASEQNVIRLKKLGKDTAQLESLIAAAKAKYEEIKGMAVGSDEWMDAVQELAEMGQQFATATGGTEDINANLQQGPGAFGAMPQISMPKGF